MRNNERRMGMSNTVVCETRARVERIIKRNGEDNESFTDRVNGAMQRINSNATGKDSEFVDWTDWLQDGYGGIAEVVIHVAEAVRIED